MKATPNDSYVSKMCCVYLDWNEDLYYTRLGNPDACLFPSMFHSCLVFLVVIIKSVLHCSFSLNFRSEKRDIIISREKSESVCERYQNDATLTIGIPWCWCDLSSILVWIKCSELWCCQSGNSNSSSRTSLGPIVFKSYFPRGQKAIKILGEWWTSTTKQNEIDPELNIKLQTMAKMCAQNGWNGIESSAVATLLHLIQITAKKKLRGFHATLFSSVVLRARCALFARKTTQAHALTHECKLSECDACCLLCNFHENVMLFDLLLKCIQTFCRNGYKVFAQKVLML